MRNHNQLPSTPSGKRRGTIASRYLEAVGCNDASMLSLSGKKLNDSSCTATTMDSSTASWTTMETTSRSNSSFRSSQRRQRPSAVPPPISLGIEDDCSSIESSSSPQRRQQQKSALMQSMDELPDDSLPENPLNGSVKKSPLQTKLAARRLFPKTSPKRAVQPPSFQNKIDATGQHETAPTEVMQNLSSIRGMAPPSSATSDAGAPTEIMANRSSSHSKKFVQAESQTHFPGIMRYQKATPQKCLMDDMSSTSSEEQQQSSPQHMKSLLDLQSSSLSTNDSLEPQEKSRLALHVMQQQQQLKPFLLNPDDASFQTGSSSKRVETGVDSISSMESPSQNVFQKRDHANIFPAMSDDDASSCYTQEKDPGNAAVQHVFSLDRLDFSFDSQGSPIRKTQSTARPTPVRSKSLSTGGVETRRSHPLSNFSLVSTEVHPPSFSNASLLGEIQDGPQNQDLETCTTSTSLFSTEVNPPSVVSIDDSILQRQEETQRTAHAKAQTMEGPSSRVPYNSQKPPRQEPQSRRQFGSIQDKIQAFDTKGQTKRIWKPPVQVKKWKPPSQRTSRDSMDKMQRSPIVVVGAHFDTPLIYDEMKSEGGSHSFVQDGDDDDTASVKSLREAWEQRLSLGSPPAKFVFEMQDDNMSMEDDDNASVRSLREVWERKFFNGDQLVDDGSDEEDDMASVKSRRDDLQRRILDQDGVTSTSEGNAETFDDDDGSVRNIRMRFETTQTKQEDVSRLRSLFEPKGAVRKAGPIRSRSWKATTTPGRALPVRSKSCKGVTCGSSLFPSGTCSPTEIAIAPEMSTEAVGSKSKNLETENSNQSNHDDDELSSGTAEMMGITQSENHLETVDMEASREIKGGAASAWERRKAAYMTRGLSNSNIPNGHLQGAQSRNEPDSAKSNTDGPELPKHLAANIETKAPKVFNAPRMDSQGRKGTLSMHDRLSRWSSRLKAEKEKPVEVQESNHGYAGKGGNRQGEEHNLRMLDQGRPQESRKFKSFKDSRKIATSFFPRTNQAAKSRHFQNGRRPAPAANEESEVDSHTNMGRQGRTTGGGTRPYNASKMIGKDVFRPNDARKRNFGRTAPESLAHSNETRGQSIDTEYSDAVTLDTSIAEVSNMTDPTCLQSKASRDVHSPGSCAPPKLEPLAQQVETLASHSTDVYAPLNAGIFAKADIDSGIHASRELQIANRNQLHAEDGTASKHNDAESNLQIMGTGGSTAKEAHESEDPFPSLEWANFDEETDWAKAAPIGKLQEAEPASSTPLLQSSRSVSFRSTPNPGERPRTAQTMVPVESRIATVSKSNSEILGRNQLKVGLGSEAIISANMIGDDRDIAAKFDHQQVFSPGLKKVTFDLAESQFSPDVAILPPVPSPSDSNYDAIMESRHQILLNRQRAHKERVAVRDSVGHQGGLNQQLDPGQGQKNSSLPGLRKASPRSSFFGRTHPGRNSGRHSASGATGGQSKASSRSLFSGGRKYPKKELSQGQSNGTKHTLPNDHGAQRQDSTLLLAAETNYQTPKKAPLPSVAPNRIRSPLRAKIPLYHPRSHQSPSRPLGSVKPASSSFYSRVTTTLGFAEASPRQSLVDTLMTYQSSKESVRNYAPSRNFNAANGTMTSPPSHGSEIVHASSDAEDSVSMASF